MAKIEVLVVEDESIVAKDIELTLEKFGYEVVGVENNADDAVKTAKAKKPDVVLMDIMLKGDKSGIDAAEEILAELNVPVIYLTANTDSDTVQKAKVTQPYGFITKPFKEVDINTSIEMAIYKHSKESEVKSERDMLFSVVENMSTKDSFFVKSKSRFLKIKAEDLYFVEALKDYVVVNTKDKRYTIHSTMKQIQNKLPTDKFMRVHRSYIVRLDRVHSIEYSNIRMEDVERVIPIGGSYKEDLQNSLNYL